MQKKKSFRTSKSIGDEFKEIPVPSRVRNISKEISYETLWCFLTVKGRELYGEKFQLYDEDIPVILQLLAYMIKDENLANQFSLDLQKGILLNGPVGCGKTSLMNLVRYLIVPADLRYRLRSCRDISYEYSEDGIRSLHKYTKSSFTQKSFNPITYCFDDLGLENESQHYGNHCSVMAEILLSRYEFFHSFGMITHITTNLNSSEIEKQYGLRVRSRLREMFNLVAFPAESWDKRK